jgi:thiamine transport system permease protein
LFAIPAAFVALFYAVPLLTLLGRVLRSTAAFDVVRAPGLGRIAWFTLWQAIVSTVATLLVGLVPAYVLARYRVPFRRFTTMLLTLPFMLPTVVVGAAFLALLPQAWRPSPVALLVAHVYFNVAVVVRVVGSAFDTVPHDLTGAARTLGASGWQVARHVVFPILQPALLSAATVVFLFTFTSFGAATLLTGPRNPTLEVEIVRRATQLGDVDGAAVLALLQLATLAIVAALLGRQQRRQAVTTTGRARPRVPATAAQRTLVISTVLLCMIGAATPLIAVALRSVRVRGEWTLAAWRTLGTAEVRPGIGLGIDPLAALTTSLRFAVFSAVISIAIGTAAALAIQSSRRRGRLLDTGIMLPLGTSAITIGFGMLITFDQKPFDWRASRWLVPLGHSLVAVPFVVRALLPLVRAVPGAQLEAAALLGASPTRAYLEVLVRPLLRPITAAAGIAAVISLGEFGATTFLTRSDRETMPIAIGKLLGRAGDIPRAQGYALATMLMIIAALVVIVADRPLRGRDA